jgi:hypothetical protein
MMRRLLAAAVICASPLACAGGPAVAASPAQTFSAIAGCRGNGAAGTGEVRLSWQGLPPGPTAATVKVSGGGLVDIATTVAWTQPSDAGPMVIYRSELRSTGEYETPLSFQPGRTYVFTSTWTDGYGIAHSSGPVPVTFSLCNTLAPLGIFVSAVTTITSYAGADASYTLTAQDGERCTYGTYGGISGICWPGTAGKPLSIGPPPGDVGSRELATGTRLNAPIAGSTFGFFPTVFTVRTGVGTPGSLAQESWVVAADGGVFTSPGTGFFGSLANTHLNAPIVGIAATPDGKGYWLVGADGGVFTFGDARFFGSLADVHLDAPIVGMAATSNGGGYTLVAGDGGVFTFGDAPFYGSLAGTRLDAPIVGMALATANQAVGGSSDEIGYWLAGRDGGVFTFGGAEYAGSPV